LSIKSIELLDYNAEDKFGEKYGRRIVKLFKSLVGLIFFATAVCGCASQTARLPSQEPQAAATPIPYVRNCAVLNTGSPSRFACNGKVYTSFQLAKIREEEAKKVAANQ
jgi:hypothetical protein